MRNLKNLNQYLLSKLVEFHGHTEYGVLQSKAELQWMFEHLKKSKRNNTFQNLFFHRLNNLVDQRVKTYKPLQYILGSQPFGELELFVEPPVLIPRPETEEWTLRLINLITNFVNKNKPTRPIRIFELGSGSGCISLLLAYNCPKDSISITSIDKSEKAINLCLKNYHKYKFLINNKNIISFHKVDFFNKDELSNLVKYLDIDKETDQPFFDMIVTNPPYVSIREYAECENDVKLWEDINAIVSDSFDGLKFHRYIIDYLYKYRVNNNMLVKSSLNLNCSSLNRVKDMNEPEFSDILPIYVGEFGGENQFILMENMLKNISCSNKFLYKYWKDYSQQHRVLLIY